MTVRVFSDNVLVYEADPATRVVTRWRTDGTLVPSTPNDPNPRPFTAADDAAEASTVAASNDATLTATTSLQGRLDRLATYKTDVDLTAVLAQTNNQALATATLNRALKTMIRREERLTATVALLVRLIDPALLANITDTTDA